MPKKKTTKKKHTKQECEVPEWVHEIVHECKTAKNNQKSCGTKCKCSSASGSCLYFVGFIGALIYYISTATGFWHGVLGVLKALVWPAFLVFEVFKYLGA